MRLTLAKINKYGDKFIREINEITIGLELQLFAMERYNAVHKKKVDELKDYVVKEMLTDAVLQYVKIRTKFEAGKIDDNAYKMFLKSEGIDSIEYVLNKFRQGNYVKKI